MIGLPLEAPRKPRSRSGVKPIITNDLMRWQACLILLMPYSLGTLGKVLGSRPRPKGGREGGREAGREGGRKGGRQVKGSRAPHITWACCCSASEPPLPGPACSAPPPGCPGLCLHQVRVCGARCQGARCAGVRVCDARVSGCVVRGCQGVWCAGVGARVSGCVVHGCQGVWCTGVRGGGARVSGGVVRQMKARRYAMVGPVPYPIPRWACALPQTIHQ